jgi:cytoskeletal protein CcmA (bactofilin family)
MMTMAEHFDEMTCLLYIEGQLEKERAQEFSAHMSGCSDCRKLLRALESEGVWLRESLEGGEESVPARLLEPPRRAPVPWGWLTTLGFGATGVYGLWSGMVEPWQKQFSQAGFTQGNFMAMIFFSGAFWRGWGEMRSLIEVLALISVMGIVGYLLRHSWRRFAAFGLVMGALGLSLAMPSTAAAGEFHHGEPNYTLPAGQTVNTDLFIFGQTIRIDGDVNGDVYCWGQSVTVNGHVAGDVISWGQEVRINGRVDGNVRNWSQVLSIFGTVGRNITAWTQRMEVDPKGSVGGSVTAWGEEIQLDGPVGRDVLGFGATIEMNSTIGGNVNVRSDLVEVGSGADLKGQLAYHGEKPPRIDPSAKVVGPVHEVVEERRSEHKLARAITHQVIGWAAAVVFGLVLMLIVPVFFGDVVRTADRVWSACGIGMLVLPGAVLAAVIACITIVGLAVGITTILFYLIALYSAKVIVGAWIGDKILGEGLRTGAMLGRMALGLAIIYLIHPIPWMGHLVGFVVLVWGLGAISIAAYKRIRPAITTATAA